MILSRNLISYVNTSFPNYTESPAHGAPAQKYKQLLQMKLTVNRSSIQISFSGLRISLWLVFSKIRSTKTRPPSKKSVKFLEFWLNVGEFISKSRCFRQNIPHCEISLHYIESKTQNYKFFCVFHNIYFIFMGK